MENLENKTLDLLMETDLNWTVKKMPLVSAEGNLPTKSYGMFRSDTNQWVGTVGKNYTPLQNFELAEILIQATEALNLSFNRGGHLANGSKVYLQAQLPSENIGNTEVQRWLTGLNHHDALGAIGFGSSTTCVICENTFHRAFGEVMKFRHFSNAVERLQAVIEDMKGGLNEEAKQMESFKKMARQPLKESIFRSVIQACFKVDIADKENQVSKRGMVKLDAINRAIETEINLEGSTLWGLFNGITRFTNHVTKSKDKNKSLMMGAGYELNNIAYRTIMSSIEEIEKEAAETVLVG